MNRYKKFIDIYNIKNISITFKINFYFKFNTFKIYRNKKLFYKYKSKYKINIDLFKYYLWLSQIIKIKNV